MSVSLVGSATTVSPFVSGTGVSYAAGAGSNRVVLLILMHSSSSGDGVPVGTGIQPTYNGVNMLSAISFVTSGVARYQCGSAWICKEANIPGSAQTINATWSNASNNLNEADGLALVATFSGVDQTTPVSSNATGLVDNDTTITCGAVATTNGGMAVYGLSYNASTGTGTTLPSGYTTDMSITPFDFSGFGAAGHKSVSAGSDSPAASWTGAGGAIIMGLNLKAFVANTRHDNLTTFGVSLAPLAWVINRRNKLRAQFSQDKRSRLFLPRKVLS
jgi:hypothetical protein